MVDDDKNELEEIFEEHTPTKIKIFSIVTKNKWFILSLISLFTFAIILNKTNDRLSNLGNLGYLSNLHYLWKLTDINSSIEDINSSFGDINSSFGDINSQLDEIESNLTDMNKKLYDLHWLDTLNRL